jgi:transposase-like protein
MSNHKAKFTPEFKHSAIQLALNSEKSTSAIAIELGIANQTLYVWLKEYRIKHNLELPHHSSRSPKQSSETLEAENTRLRKELKRVTQEREILKKATVYFAKEAQ